MMVPGISFTPLYGYTVSIRTAIVRFYCMEVLSVRKVYIVTCFSAMAIVGLMTQTIPAKTTLRVVHWWGANDFKPTFDLFEKENPSISIKQEVRPWGETYVSKLLLETAAGVSSDVYFVDGQWYSSLFFKNAVFMPLERFVKEDKLDLSRFAVDPYLEHGSSSHLYALAQWIADGPSLWVNKSLLRGAGVEAPVYGTSQYDKWNWSDLLAASRKTTRTDANGQTTQWGMWPINHPVYVTYWGWQNGADFFNDVACKKETLVNFSQPAFLETVQFMADIMNVYKVAPPLSRLPSYSQGSYLSGKVAFSQGWSIYSDLRRAKFEWAFIPTPWEKRRVTKYGGNSWSIGAKAKNAKAAWTFVKWMTTSPVALNSISRVGGLGAYNVDALAAAEADADKLTMNKVLVSRVKDVTWRPLWLGHVNPTKVTSVLQGYIDKVLLNKLSAAAAMGAVDREINSSIYKK